ncbi:hypothetical protein D1007_19742 [Hordeum vulgare]|nr:hypothetical protein D1007_19742 [Hordeum vulgare]
MVRKPLQKNRGHKGKKKGPQPPPPPLWLSSKSWAGGRRPEDCFRCGSLEHFSRPCHAPQEVVNAYKSRKAREMHLALVQEESPAAPPAAPMMIPTPPPAPIVATSAVPTGAPLAVSNDSDIAMEVEHMVAPMMPPLAVDVATNMMSMEDGITSLETQAEVNGFFAEST